MPWESPEGTPAYRHLLLAVRSVASADPVVLRSSESRLDQSPPATLVRTRDFRASAQLEPERLSSHQSIWRKRHAYRQLISARTVALGVVLALTACAERQESRAISKCEQQHSEDGDPLLILVGRDGVRELCTCTIGETYKRLPDADRRVEAWIAATEREVGKRGLLGIVTDTAWGRTQAGELTLFINAYGSAWTACTERLLREPRQR